MSARSTTPSRIFAVTPCWTVTSYFSAAKVETTPKIISPAHSPPRQLVREKPTDLHRIELSPEGKRIMTMQGAPYQDLTRFCKLFWKMPGRLCLTLPRAYYKLFWSGLLSEV